MSKNFSFLGLVLSVALGVGTPLASMNMSSIKLTSTVVLEGVTAYQAAQSNLRWKQYTGATLLLAGVGYGMYYLAKNTPPSSKLPSYSMPTLTTELNNLEGLTPAPKTWLAWGIGSLKGWAWSQAGAFVSSILCARLIFPLCNSMLPIKKPWTRTVPLEWFITSYAPQFATYQELATQYTSYMGYVQTHAGSINPKSQQIVTWQQQLADTTAQELEKYGPTITRNIQIITGAITVIAEQAGTTTYRGKTLKLLAQQLIDTLNTFLERQYKDPKSVQSLVTMVEKAITVADQLPNNA